MRTRDKAFLSCAAVAVAASLVATIAMATGYSNNTPTPAPTLPPTSCFTGGTYNFKIEVSNGPTAVSCDAPGDQCTEIEYTVSHSTYTPDHVGALAGRGVWNVEGPGVQWYAPGEGDPVFGMGRNALHEQAVKINPVAKVQKFTITLAGARGPSPTSVFTKKGTKVAGCRILGIGLESGPNPFATTVDDVDEVLGGKCKVRASTNRQTGETTLTLLESLPGYTCTTPEKIPFSNVHIAVTDESGQPQTEPLKFSEGFAFVAGNGTCGYKQYYPPSGPVYRVCW